jgi:hypothetical protein
MKIIGLFGMGQTDICIYLASILQNLGYRVCVVDNSYEQAMQYCIPHPGERLDTVTYKKIDYERLIPAESWQERDYDYLLVDLGVWPPTDALGYCREIYLVLDSAIAQVYRYRELMKRLELPMNVILRDLCPEAVSGKEILELLSRENCFLVDTYMLPLREEDQINRIGMQYQGYHRFTHLSPAFEKLLVGMCRELCDCEDARIWRSFRAARKGVCA